MFNVFFISECFDDFMKVYGLYFLNLHNNKVWFNDRKRIILLRDLNVFKYDDLNVKKQIAVKIFLFDKLFHMFFTIDRFSALRFQNFRKL